MMVGNSVRSDVLPVLALGGTAVYIPHAHTWSHELAAEPSGADGRYFTLDALGDLPPLVRRLALNG
jgi:putative hydrolase of the HAD superfamily